MPDDSATAHQTRWQRARSDTKPISWRREAGSAVIGAVGAFAIWVWGSGGAAAVDTIIAVIAGALLVAVVVPSAELLWNWTQARHRMVIDELRELRSAITLTAPPPDRVALPLKERLVIARRQGRDIRHGLVSASHGEADEWRTKLERWTKQVEYVLAREAPTHLERFSSDFELPVDRIPWSPITGLRAAADHRIAILDQMLVELEPEYPGGAIN